MKLQADGSAYVCDVDIAKELEIDPDEVRGHLEIIVNEPRADVVSTSSGYCAFLHPGQRQAVKEAQMAAPTSGNHKPDPRNVFVVHGRNMAACEALFVFLRAINLRPLEWNQLVTETGAASPYTGEVVNAGFEQAQAIVVALTPDDLACLQKRFRKSDDGPDETSLTPQPRPNVLIEAGIALGRDAKRTVLVQFGTVRKVSDLEGRNVVRMADTPEKRKELADRLRTAGCDVDTTGNHWMRAGDFAAAISQCANLPAEEMPGSGARESNHVPQKAGAKSDVKVQQRGRSKGVDPNSEHLLAAKREDPHQRELQEHERQIRLIRDNLDSLTPWQRDFLARLILEDRRQIRDYEIGGYRAVWGSEIEVLVAKRILKHHFLADVYEIEPAYYDYLKQNWNPRTGEIA